MLRLLIKRTIPQIQPIIKCENNHNMGMLKKIRNLSLGDSDSDSSSSSSSSEPKDPRDRIVKRPKEHDTYYRVLTLKNKLRCLLISDEEERSENASYRSHDLETTENAAVCLSVQVGSMQDPDAIPGLAHFLEHMLFMGSKKYPNENEYDEYLDEHGGSSNASTDHEMTSYVFDVSDKNLQEGIDRFAHQFISPLFKKSSVHREVKAVDSEYMESLQSDSEVLTQICQSIIQTDHPFNRFTMGNKETLVNAPKRNGVDYLEELREFHGRYYSANLMCLCVASTHSLDELEEMIKIFERIPNKNTPVPTFENTQLPKSRYNFIKYFPVKDRKRLIMYWFLPPQLKRYRAKSVEYVDFLVGHEGCGSLLAAIKRKGYGMESICGTSPGGFDSNSNFTRVYIEISLSDKGLDCYTEVINMVFTYLAMLKQSKPKKRIYDELKKMGEIDFENMENEEPYDKVEQLAEDMTMYSPEDYLAGSYFVFDEFCPDKITEILDSLVPENMTVVLQSKTFKEECTTKEVWSKGMYCATNFDPEFIEDLSYVKNTAFRLPEPNPYIPEDLELKDGDVEGSGNVPVIVADKPGLKIWFYVDDVFEDPSCMINIHLFNDEIGCSTSEYAVGLLYVWLFNNNVSELFYPAEIAGLSSEFSVGREGYTITFEGYNDKLLKYFKGIIDQFFRYEKNIRNFSAVKDQAVRDIKIKVQKPKNHVDDLRQSFLRRTYISSVELAEALDKLTEHDLLNFRVKGRFNVEVLCGGNITFEEITEYIDHLKDKINLEENILARNKIRLERVYQIPRGRLTYRAPNKMEGDVNTAVKNYYQHDVVSFRDTILLDLIEDFMAEPSFNQLRTRLQLGYVVTAECHNTYGVTGYSISVQTQATKFSAKEVNMYIESFISWFSQYLTIMEEDKFKSRITEIIKKKLSPFLNMDDEFELKWDEIVTQEYIFDRETRAAEILKSVTKPEVIRFYHDLFYSNVRKISIQVEGDAAGTDLVNGEEGSDDEAEDSSKFNPKEEELLPHMTRLSKEATSSWTDDSKTLSSVEELHTKSTLLPVYRMVTKVITEDITNNVD